MDLAQALFLLKSLQKNIPNDYEVDRKWVDDFHSILDSVEKDTEADLSAFRIQPSELHRRVLGTAPIGPNMQRETKYGGTVVERARLIQKVDAVLGYFEFSNSTPKQSIGFKK